MAVESATYVGQLNPAFPAGAEPVAQGDDHLRLLKQTIQNSFPNLNAAMTAGWLPSTPTGDVAATNVQAAIAELAAEKLALAGGTMTGFITLHANPTSALHAATKQYADNASFPSGTRLLFAQAAAPSGWTQITDDTANNRMLRVQTGAGGGVAGTSDPTLMNVVPAHSHNFTSGNVSADHTHAGSTGGRSTGHYHGLSTPAHAHSVQLYVAGSNTWQAGASAPTIGSPVSTSGNASGDSVGIDDRDHTHSFSTGGISANHTHSGQTDSGSSQTNWAPRYLNMILCSKV